MVESSEHRDCVNASLGFRGTWNGLLVRESLVRACVVVETHVLGDNASKMFLAEDEDVIEQLSAECARQALSEGIHVRRAYRRAHDAHPRRPEYGSEPRAELRVVVADDNLWYAVHAGVPCLLRAPLVGWRISHRGMEDRSPTQIQEEEYEHLLEPHVERLHEVTRPRHVVSQERRPALAVASGNSLERLLLLDGETSRVVGVYPEETSALENFLDALDSSRPKPAGPRGKLLTPQPGFSPPLRTPLPPAPPSAGFPPAGPLDAGTPAETPPAGKPGATREARSQREPQRESGPEGAAPANGASHPEEASVLEEVADPFLSGRITGALSLVGAVILYGPDSITTERDRVTPQSDGTYRFSLPSKGRYRIVLAGSSRTTLSCRPAFQTIEVGDYGYRGLDFEVRGAVGGR